MKPTPGFVAVLALTGVLLTVPACQESTAPDAFQAVVGAWCTETQRDHGALVGTAWEVMVFINRTQRQPVTDANGFVREQEIRSCEERHCTIRDPSLSENQAIALCRST